MVTLISALQNVLPEADRARQAIGLGALAVGLVTAVVGSVVTVRYLRRFYATPAPSEEAVASLPDTAPALALPGALIRGRGQVGVASVPPAPLEETEREPVRVIASARFWTVFLAYVAWACLLVFPVFSPTGLDRWVGLPGPIEAAVLLGYLVALVLGAVVAFTLKRDEPLAEACFWGAGLGFLILLAGGGLLFLMIL